MYFSLKILRNNLLIEVYYFCDAVMFPLSSESVFVRFLIFIDLSFYAFTKSVFILCRDHGIRRMKGW